MIFYIGSNCWKGNSAVSVKKCSFFPYNFHLRKYLTDSSKHMCKRICIQILTVALITIAKSRQSKCLSIEDRLSKFWMVYIREQYVDIVNKLNIYVPLHKYF